MKFEAGTYSRNLKKYDAKKFAGVVRDMREYTDRNFQRVEEERHLARLGILELRAKGII
jgi:hypothetical protein